MQTVFRRVTLNSGPSSLYPPECWSWRLNSALAHTRQSTQLHPYSAFLFLSLFTLNHKLTGERPSTLGELRYLSLCCPHLFFFFPNPFPSPFLVGSLSALYAQYAH